MAKYSLEKRVQDLEQSIDILKSILFITTLIVASIYPWVFIIVFGVLLWVYLDTKE